jgi:hypothetical protein
MNSLSTQETNLATTNKTDFTVTESGDAFISQRKLAELCGVALSAVQKHLASGHPKYLNDNGITAENAILVVTHYAVESKAANDTARKTLALVAQAGMKAYIYHEAGYVMQAVQPKQMSQLEILSQSIQMLVEQDKRLTSVEASIARLTGETNYMAILAWANKNGLKIPISRASQMGKQASSYCRLMDIEIGTVKDERYYEINTYQESILDMLFGGKK